MKRHTRFPRWPSPLLLCAMLAAVLPLWVRGKNRKGL